VLLISKDFLPEQVKEENRGEMASIIELKMLTLVHCLSAMITLAVKMCVVLLNTGVVT